MTKRICDRCSGNRVALISAKSDDRCFVELNGNEKIGYPPSDMLIKRSDMIEFSYCLDCGKIQGNFPLETCDLEKSEDLWDE